MKTYECKSNIGAGLFSDEPQDVEIRFPNGETANLRVIALTQEVMIELQNKGIKFENYRNLADANLNMRKIVDTLIIDGTIGDVILDEKVRARILSHHGLTSTLLEIARDLAEEIVETSEGNSDS